MFDLNQTLKERKKSFQTYINGLHLTDEMKGFIADDMFIDKNPSIYLLYPEIFSYAFDKDSNIPETKIQHLNFAGYLYYRSIIEVDTTIDRVDLPEGKQPEKHVLPILSSICQEESIKLLSSLFSLNSEFWKIWSIRRHEYIQAIIMDRRNPKDITIADFENLADYKSAFGKIAIDSVYQLSGCQHPEIYQNLLTSHKYFSVGFQLLDDLMDFKKDIIHPQVNYAHVLLRRSLKEKNIDFDKTDPNLLTKYLYVNGTAETLMEAAKEYFNKALALIENVNLPLWRIFIEGKKSEANAMLLHLRAYDKTLYASAKLSTSIYKDGKNIYAALDMAKNFITSHQNSDGSWEDYYNNAGLSNIWSTGFILSHISNLKTGFTKDNIDNACSFLLQNRQGNLWGYNTNWIEDTDSTTLALCALSMNKHNVSKEVNDWLKWQKNNGGFSTYPDSGRLSKLLNYEFNDLQGWTQNHTCVSGMAFYFMNSFMADAIETQKLRNYMLTQQSPNGIWESYWWNSPLYSTCYFLQGYFSNETGLPKATIESALTSLLSFQQKDGGFVDSYSNKSFFYTALALNTLCSSPAVFSRFSEEAKSAANYLLASQFTDGSFDSSYSLQIPYPAIIDVKEVKEWKKSVKSSTNIVVNDFMRLFTTAAVIKALDSFQGHIK